MYAIIHRVLMISPAIANGRPHNRPPDNFIRTIEQELTISEPMAGARKRNVGVDDDIRTDIARSTSRTNIAITQGHVLTAHAKAITAKMLSRKHD